MKTWFKEYAILKKDDEQAKKEHAAGEDDGEDNEEGDEKTPGVEADPDKSGHSNRKK